jgi:hypothetical protein
MYGSLLVTLPRSRGQALCKVSPLEPGSPEIWSHTLGYASRSGALLSSNPFSLGLTYQLTGFQWMVHWWVLGHIMDPSEPAPTNVPSTGCFVIPQLRMNLNSELIFGVTLVTNFAGPIYR